MIYIIDGTGDSGEREYNADMNRGFCWKIHKQSSTSVYLRGPTKSGLSTWNIGDDLYKKIKETCPVKITLVGHSRGGAACIYVAHRLKKDGINVNAMLLFDAVERVFAIPNSWAQVNRYDIDVIPSNVSRSLHLMRDEEFSNYFINTPEYKELKNRVKMSGSTMTKALTGQGTTSDRMGGAALKIRTPDEDRLQKLEQFHAEMRDACRFDVSGTGFSFGNTGTKHQAPCKALATKYQATHGAMGGAPLQASAYIKDIKYAKEIEYQEIASMLAIEAQANAFLKEVGESGELKLDYIPACMPFDQTAIKR